MLNVQFFFIVTGKGDLTSVWKKAIPTVKNLVPGFS